MGVDINIIVFLFGLVIGSYTNVLDLRGSFRASFQSRSKCPMCKETLTALMLVPVISYICQMGKCVHCKCKISMQYPVVEISVAVLYALTYYFFGFTYFAIAMYLLVPALVAVIASDVRDMTIGNYLLYYMIVVSGVYAAYLLYTTHILEGVFSALYLTLPFALTSLVTRERAFGWGDSYIALALGLVAGTYVQALHIFMFSFWIGTVVVVVYFLYKYIKGGSYAMARNMRVPFAPFFILAFFLVVFVPESMFLFVGVL